MSGLRPIIRMACLIGVTLLLWQPSACSKRSAPSKVTKPPIQEVIEAAPTPKAQTKEASRPAIEASQRHPAADEKDYPLKTIDEITQDTEGRNALELLKVPTNGAKVLRMVKPMGKSGIALMTGAVRAAHREIRMQAALILANLKTTDHTAVEALSEAVLYDPDPDVRATAAKAFVNIKSTRAAGALIRSLTEDPFETARANAAWALGSIGGGEMAIAALRKGLKDSDTWVRLRCASSLKKLNAKSAIADLIDTLDDHNPMVRERALEALKALTKKAYGTKAEDWRAKYLK